MRQCYPLDLVPPGLDSLVLIEKFIVFIVIEGIDGTGKATQTALLREFFEAQGKGVDIYDFPAYESFVGKELGGLLSGGAGGVNASSLPGKVMAMLFSLDRMQFLERIKSSIANGRVVISNRYSLSNAAFQSIRCGEDISAWVYELEHGALNLPRPDLYIILKGSIESSQKNVGTKGQRTYTDGHDLYERDKDLLSNAQRMYCSLSTGGVPRVIIDCLSDGEFKSREDIMSEIIRHINNQELSIGELVVLSNVRGYVFTAVTNTSLELDLIRGQVGGISDEHVALLEILAGKLYESEVGGKFGILSDFERLDSRERVSRYLFVCAVAKIYIPMMYETTSELKKRALEEYCFLLKGAPDSIVLMDRYSRETFGG